MTTTDTVAYHRKETRRLLREVDDALGRGDLESAPTKLWSAAAESIRGAAAGRGWEYGSDSLLSETVDRLVDEENLPSDLIGQFLMLYAFRAAPVSHAHSPGKIRYGRGQLAQFVYALEYPKPPTLSEIAPPPPSTAADAAEYYREESWRRLRRVNDDLDAGLGEHARDQLWAAAAHSIKSAAARRGWPHESVLDLGETADRLAAEEGMPSRLGQLYLLGSAYSREGWQVPMNTERICYTKADIAQLMAEFEAWDVAQFSASHGAR
ncbi:MAG: hypothetical protein J4G13_11810 [Dehalococcoidia bacterium]|nr:hypothetical protein [Dehalococcoidia bacterium]